MLLDLNKCPNWCLSGGADGADLQWGMVAGSIGHGVIHYSFAGHTTQAPEVETVRLSKSQLQAADPHCHTANKTLRRRYPSKSPSITNLLRRDWYQVQPAQSCYAVSTFSIPVGPTIPLGEVIRSQVKGGTAWAVQMFIDKHLGPDCPCYVFDQVLSQWFQWIGDGWQCIYQPPMPSGIYAGIGATDLQPIGRLAIRVLMGYQKKITDTSTTRQQAEQAAKRVFEERARLMEGHKMGSWESLSDLMKEALIHAEMKKLD